MIDDQRNVIARALRDSHYQLSRKTAEKLADVVLALLAERPLSLRDRIIKIIHDDGARPADTAARLADAVIREIGMTQQSIDTPSGYKVTRWVTVWEK